VTGPDNNISAALVAFANHLQQAAEAGLAGPFSARQSENRLQRLHQIAKEAEALAEHSESASYQAFARLLAKAEEKQSSR
jgi:hypothetical protein